ncbi:MAG: ABC transporter substrate-binding protein [Pseudomonadota bacterium]
MNAFPQKIWLVIVLFLLEGCQGERELSSADNSTIRFATAQPLQTFDPHQADTGTSFSTYLTLVYDGLIEGNPDDMWSPLPGLAKSWHWLDETTLEFDLVEGVTFSDGEPFDATVAKQNIDRMLALRGPRFNTVESIQSAEALGSRTLRLRLHRADPTLLVAMAGPPGMMISPRAFENQQLDLEPVGTGPWLYDRNRSTVGEVHRFTPRPGYFKASTANPSLANYAIHYLPNARARLNALISGQIDIALVTHADASSAESIGFKVARRANRWFGITFLDRNGELVPELADPRVRQAMGYAVDRAALAKALFFGYAQPSSQPMVEGLGYVSELENYYRYDPDYARQLLQSAGVDEFSFVAPVLPTESAHFEAVQHYLSQVGIHMQIHVTEPSTIAAISRTRRYPINTLTYPNYNPDSRHLAIWGTDAIFNPFKVVGHQTDALALEARASLDEELRARNYDAYYRIVIKDVYSMIYLQVEDLVAYDAAKLDGVRIGGFVDPLLRRIALKSDSVSP